MKLRKGAFVKDRKSLHKLNKCLALRLETPQCLVTPLLFF